MSSLCATFGFTACLIALGVAGIDGTTAWQSAAVAGDMQPAGAQPVYLLALGVIVGCVIMAIGARRMSKTLLNVRFVLAIGIATALVQLIFGMRLIEVTSPAAMALPPFLRGLFASVLLAVWVLTLEQIARQDDRQPLVVCGFGCLAVAAIGAIALVTPPAVGLAISVIAPLVSALLAVYLLRQLATAKQTNGRRDAHDDDVTAVPANSSPLRGSHSLKREIVFMAAGAVVLGCIQGVGSSAVLSYDDFAGVVFGNALLSCVGVALSGAVALGWLVIAHLRSVSARDTADTVIQPDCCSFMRICATLGLAVCLALVNVPLFVGHAMASLCSSFVFGLLLIYAIVWATSSNEECGTATEEIAENGAHYGSTLRVWSILLGTLKLSSTLVCAAMCSNEANIAVTGGIGIGAVLVLAFLLADQTLWAAHETQVSAATVSVGANASESSTKGTSTTSTDADDDNDGAKSGDAAQIDLRKARSWGITDRELDLIDYLARGYTTTYAASELGISPQTARTHLKNAYARTDTHSRDELLSFLRKSA